MTDYDKLVKDLRENAERYCRHCAEKSGEHLCGYKGDQYCFSKTLLDAADVIEELLSDYGKLYEKDVDLLKAAKAMHTWIFLHTGDEQEAYDECGLSDEMNVELGYSGQWELRATPPKEDEA